MPIEKVDGGYRWGKHGKVYKDRKGAEKQAAAAHANGYRGDATTTTHAMAMDATLNGGLDYPMSGDGSIEAPPEDLYLNEDFSEPIDGPDTSNK